MNVNKLTKELEKRLGVEVRWEDGKIVRIEDDNMPK